MTQGKSFNCFFTSLINVGSIALRLRSVTSMDTPISHPSSAYGLLNKKVGGSAKVQFPNCNNPLYILLNSVAHTIGKLEQSNLSWQFTSTCSIQCEQIGECKRKQNLR